MKIDNLSVIHLCILLFVIIVFVEGIISAIKRKIENKKKKNKKLF